MDLQQFYRQARSFRDYTPVLTASGAMTIKPGYTITCQYQVIGTLVVGFVKATLETLGTGDFNVYLTTPTTIRTDLSSFAGTPPVFFSGTVEAFKMGYGLRQSSNQIAVKKYDNSAWGISSGYVILGVFGYMNGE